VPISSKATTTATIPTVAVRYASEDAPALRYLRAAGVAWRAATTNAKSATVAASPIVAAPASQVLDAETRNLVWLVPGPLPKNIRDWIGAGGHALLAVDAETPEFAGATPLWRDEEGDALVRGAPLGRGRIMQLTRALSPSVMPQLLQADFPEHLRGLFAEPIPAPARVVASAYAPMTGVVPYPETPRPLSLWLVGLVAALFVLERWLASGARREAAP
jgi:hypothetical protein